MTSLGRLEQVDLRAAWTNEATDFTPWLAQPENISLLSETLGYGPDGLEVEAIEAPVGFFRADVLARDVANDQRVLIENQLEKTDHRHLGQILTYAAGLEAQTVIWVAAKVQEEHKAAVDWLNEISKPDHRFFAVEVELWRIDEGPAAPKFEVISAPNDWSRRVSAAASRVRRGAGSDADLGARYRTAFQERADAALAGRRGAVSERNWIGFALGADGQRLVARIRPQSREVQVELYIKRRESPELFARLLARRTEIEAAYGAPLLWDERTEATTSGVIASLVADPEDSADWPRQQAWIADQVVRMRAALKPFVIDAQRVSEDAPQQ